MVQQVRACSLCGRMDGVHIEENVLSLTRGLQLV